MPVEQLVCTAAVWCCEADAPEISVYPQTDQLRQELGVEAYTSGFCRQAETDERVCQPNGTDSVLTSNVVTPQTRTTYPSQLPPLDAADRAAAAACVSAMCGIAFLDLRLLPKINT